jgi:uncharacterized protein (UPF0548 family)
MILLRKPSEEAIRAFLARQHDLGFSYAEVGATRSELPPGYVVDHSRIALGTGPAVYSAAVAAVRRCAMFRLRWVELHRRDAPIEAGLTVAVLAQAGLWWLNAARVVYTFDEAGPPRRFGFAYGTLPDHAERGAERFMVEEREADDSVWYDILAFSSEPARRAIRAPARRPITAWPAATGRPRNVPSARRSATAAAGPRAR